MDYQITGKFIEKLEQISRQLKLKKSTHRKIVTLMVEIIENNYKYVNELDDHIVSKSHKKPYFLLKKEEDFFRLESGNPILKKDAETLKKKLDYINQLSYDELQELYKNTMANGIYENKKGAGLGILKMTKISKNNIYYRIVDITEHLAYYTIRVYVPLNL
ncbi:MAG: SiaB family protein kinase [Bacteroidales bacterium]|nr:SiaB family protein kinase [Bacteroidales bacterium]MBS3773696.1 SiaB family protein kinase [Bacteroidales bacterium]